MLFQYMILQIFQIQELDITNENYKQFSPSDRVSLSNVNNKCWLMAFSF